MKMSKKIKLGDTATFINGYAFKPADRGEVGLPIIRIQDLTGNAYDLGFYEGEYPEKIEINDGDVLISWSASLGVYVWNRGKALLNQHIFKVVFNKVDINKQYFVYAVKYKLAEMTSKTHGATMKHIVKKDFDATEIPYPNMEQQKEITNILNKAAFVVGTRKKEIQKLDDLIKARFIELFGDPAINSKGWKTKSLLDMGYCKNGMNFHTGDSGIEMHCLGVGDFKDLSIIDGTESLSVISLNEAPPEESMLRDGDIVFVRSNGNKALVGRCLVVYPHNTPTTYSGFCIRYRLTSSEVNTTYLLRVLKTDSMRKKMAGRGANIQNLNQQILATLDIPLPPIEQQQQFANFVEQVDKSKVKKITTTNIYCFTHMKSS